MSLTSVKLADYTRAEDWLNSISHMVGGAFGIVAFILIMIRAGQTHRWDYALTGALYCFCMIAMYSCSAIYHALYNNNGKRAMRMVDHAMIFPMIAGTITPYAILVIAPVSSWMGWTFFGVTWAIVALAVPLTLTMFNQTKVFQQVVYIGLGWLVIAFFGILWKHFDRTGLWLLLAGGIAYTVGAILYGIGSKKRYFHTVFHFFVLIGSLLHFLSLYLYVFVK